MKYTAKLLINGEKAKQITFFYVICNVDLFIEEEASMAILL